MNDVNFSDDECNSQESQDGLMFDALTKIDDLVGSDDDKNASSLKTTLANVSLNDEASPQPPRRTANQILDSDSDSNAAPIIHESEPETRPETSSSSNSDSDSDLRITKKPEAQEFNQESRAANSDSENEANLDGDRPKSENSEKSDSDSDDEPVRIFRGSAPLPVQENSDDEMMDSSSTPNVSKPGSKKPRSRPQEEEESFRDRQIRMREEHEDAKAEQARLLRETEIKLPRHQKVFSLDLMSPPKSSKPKSALTSNSTTSTAENNSSSTNPDPQSDKKARIAAKKARIAALASAKAPTPGQGFLQLNPKMSDLQQKMVKHLRKKKSPTKMCTKITEAVKNDVGEIVEIKEKIIQVEVRNEAEEIFNSLRNKKSKLTGLKQQLWENLRAERIKNFKEEQERLKAQEEMDEDNYLDKMDKELEDEQMPPDALDSSESGSGEEGDEESTDKEENDENQSKIDHENSNNENAEESEKMSSVKVKKRRKKKREKKARKILESSDEEDEDPVSEPFQNLDSDTTSQSSNNPYNNMSKLTSTNYHNATTSTPAQVKNLNQELPATPDRLSSLSSKSFGTPTPSEGCGIHYQSPGNFSLDYDFDENTESQMSRPTQERMNDDSNPFKTQPDRSADNRLFQEFLEDENAKDANDVQQEVDELCAGSASPTQDTQALAAMFDDSDDDCMPSTSTAKVAEPVPAIPVDDNSVNSHDRESLGFSSSRDANDDSLDDPMGAFEEAETLTEPDKSERKGNVSLPVPDMDIMNASLPGSVNSNKEKEADSNEEEEPELPPVNDESDDDLVIVKKKVKPKVKKPKPGLTIEQFADKDEAELSDDGQKVSDDESDEIDEYEHEEITEVLPSQRKMQKEIQKVHNKLVRDEDEEIIARIEGKYNDDVAQAQARKSKYKWVINNEGFDMNEGSSEEEEVDEEKVKALQNEESDRLKQKLERELLVDQETQETLFSNTQSSLFSNATAVKLTSKRKKNGFAKSASQKRKDRFGQAFAGLSKGEAFSKPMTFQAAEKENRKRQSDGAGNFPKRQKTAPDTPKAQKMKKSLFNQI
ncbi:unnamed protein product [Oikopleura dioica]|uniref:Uncharacterized protein n=1 Tax=Oikopleura dioica TaxID=34765 RepID=E4YRK3_OIKDI|nr:unnamed protein product [Oikopleura dioica]